MLDTVPFLGETLHRWRIGRSTFLAHPQRGARLMNWNLALADGSVRDVIHWPEIESFEGFSSVRGGNPILFPFNARSFDRGEIYHWRDEGVRRPMPMHGIARQGRFELTRADASGFAAVLRPDAAAREAYPYDYEFTVIYRFGPASLTCEFVLKNLDTRPIPWSAGHHFYFHVPWEPGRTRGDYRMSVPATRRLRQDAQGQLVPGPAGLPASDSLANPDWIDTFHLGLSSPTALLAPAGGGRSGAISVTLGVDKKSPPPPEATFVTWSQKPDSPFFCIEPWMGPPNSAETGVGLHHVIPGRSQSFVVEVALAT